MPADVTDVEALNQLLDELDARGQAQRATENSDEYWVCQRRYRRYPFRARCTVRFLKAGTLDVSESPGRTRNLSRSGLAFLVRSTFNTGEPIELEVCAAQRPRMYIAGRVTFSRYAGGGWYEVGVSLKAAQSEPVFSHNPSEAMQSIEWLQDETDAL